MSTMLPGDFYLTRISGIGGAFVTASQWVIGDLSRYTHAGIYLGDIKGNGVPLVAETLPGGVQINPLSKYDGKELVHSKFDLTGEQRWDIAHASLALEGTPYSYLGYLYVGLMALNHCPQWVEHKVSSSKAMFCSQLVDYVYSKNGVQLFDDDRLYLNVTPGDLARLLAEI